MKAKLFALLFVAISAVGYGQGKYGATPDDSVTCIENLSLYTEFYKQKNYNDAKGPWEIAMNTCPKSSKNLYIKGASMYKYFIKKEKDAAAKTELVNKLMWIYDQRIENFGQKGSVLGRKGSDLFRYGGKERTEEAYAILKESVELQKHKSEGGAIAAYYQCAERMTKMGKYEKADLIALYPVLNGYTETNIKKYAEKEQTDKNVKKVEKWKTVATSLEAIFIPYATCDALVEIYTPKFEAEPTNPEVLEQIIKFFERQNCTDHELFLKASMELHKIQPSGLSAIGIGASLLKKEKYSEAMPYLKEAGEIAEDDATKIKAFKYAANGSLALKQYSSAKNYALKMLKIDANNADAYMIIGDAYFYGSKTVGDNPCMKNGGYWAAPAKYYKAKSLNPDLAEKVGKKLGQVAAQLPSKEDCFFYNITDGQKVTIGGWINETVTVKTK